MRTHTRNRDSRPALALTGVFVLCAGLLITQAGTATAASDDYMPDALVRKGKPSIDLTVYKGFATFSPNGQGQTINKRVKPGGKAVFSVGYYNGGTLTDSYRIRGCRGSHGLKVRYFMQPLSSVDYTLNVTSQMRAGMMMTGVAPGTGYALLVKVKIPKGAGAGERWWCNFGAWSEGSGNTSYDVARWKVKVAG